MIRFRHAARNVQWRGGFGDFGNITYLPKTRGWRTMPPAVIGMGGLGAEPPALKNFVIFLAKITEF